MPDPSTTDQQLIAENALLKQKVLDLEHSDIERRQAEESLARLMAMFDATPGFVGYADARDSHILYINSAGRKMVGVRAQEDVTQLKIAELHPQWANKLLLDKIIPTAIRDGTWVGECAFLNRDGREIPVLMTLLAHKSPRGEVERFSTVSIDVTERKRAEGEKARLEAQLRQAQKMESVGRLAGGVAHDFNNMLGVILGHADLAMEQLGSAHPVRADLTEIQAAATRSAGLTRQLLAFARKQTIAPKVLDLNETVGGMLTMLRRLIGEDIDLAWHPGANLWPVKVDPSQIDQILTNLCINARDAIADVGKVTIETGNATLDEDYCAHHAGFVPGAYVRLVASDDGCGMDKDTQAHLFEPFFTTKEMGKGSGLGLATVYGIVKQNQGFINVYSEPGQGTTFSIYLPRHVGKAEQARTDGAAAAVRGHETILLVEDEPAILKLATTMLERQGYAVLAASTPGEAIRLARKYGGAIHLLMTDVIMPEMNGRDLAKNLLNGDPHLKRLFMSGHAADVIADRGVLDAGVSFIQKPFSVKELAAKVRETLDRQ